MHCIEASPHPKSRSAGSVRGLRSPGLQDRGSIASAAYSRRIVPSLPPFETDASRSQRQHSTCRSSRTLATTAMAGSVSSTQPSSRCSRTGLAVSPSAASDFGRRGSASPAATAAARPKTWKANQSGCDPPPCAERDSIAMAPTSAGADNDRKQRSHHLIALQIPLLSRTA